MPTITIAKGGTGATTAAGALVALGAAAADNSWGNYLINPLGTINQRGYASGAATGTANQYTVDRFRVVVSGQNVSWSSSNNVFTFTCPAGGFEQVIEGSSLVSGTYAISWVGTATATVNGVAATNGSTVTVVGGVNQTIRWSSGTMSLPQFTKGSTIQEFSPRQFQQELALCQRYFSLFDFGVGAAYSVGGAGAAALGLSPFPVQMRATPTLTLGTLSSATNASAVAFASTTAFATIVSVTQDAAAGNFSISYIRNRADAEL